MVTFIDQVDEAVKAVRAIKELEVKIAKQIPRGGYTTDEITLSVTKEEAMLIATVLEKIVEGL